MVLHRFSVGLLALLAVAFLPSDSARAAYSCPITYTSCNANYYYSGGNCTACSSLSGSYTLKDGANTNGSTSCYKTCAAASTCTNCSLVRAAEKVYSPSGACSYALTCSNGYYSSSHGGSVSTSTASCTACTNTPTYYTYANWSYSSAATSATGCSTSISSCKTNSVTNTCGNACTPTTATSCNPTSCTPAACTSQASYNLNGGSGTAPSATTCTNGTSCTLASAATNTFYRAGYQFVGWNASSSATTGSTAATISANTTFYAIWTACATGTSKGASANANAACTSCSAGTYSASTGSSSCASCAAGTYNTSAGSTSCTSCAAGTYNTSAGSTSCTSCAAGTYNTSAGSTSCTSCAAGTYNNASKSTSCTDCNAGTYNTSAGSTSCTSCAIGTYNNVKKSTSCTDCNAGTYNASAGSTSCTSCVIGSYNNAKKSSSCSACGNGSTTGAAGRTSCDATCSNGANASAWSAASWVSASNTITNLCTISTCGAGYDLSGNACGVHTYKITYYNVTNGVDGVTGITSNGGNAATYTVVTAVTFANPARTGYTFGGWYAASNFSGTAATGISVGNTGDKVFYAKWTVNTYTVSFNGNGQTSEVSTEPNSITCTYDADCTLPGRGSLARAGYIWSGWCTNTAGTANCSTTTVKNLSTGAAVTMYAKWEGCGAGKFSNTSANTCDTCAAGSYSTSAANASCTMCEAGNKCVNGAKTACGGANEWQELPEKSVCDTVEDGKKKVSGKNDKIEDCGYGYYCKNGVSTACPAGTKPLPGSAETTLAPTKSLITDCAQTGVGCTPDGGGIGEQLCYWKPSDSAYNTCETCNLIGCPPGEHQVGMSCKSNIQPCTNSEVGLNSAGGMTVSGNAKYVSDGVWDVSQCYATGLPHGGTGFHGTGTKACYWTSGLGDAGVAKFESSCNNYNLTSCDGGYYRDVANASSCVPAGIGYYSPNTSISRTRCQDSGTTATDTEDSQNKCYKENLPFDGTHCDGRQTCWLGSSGSEYKTNCQVTAITSCDAGYYYYNDGTGSAPHGTIAPKGFYSPDGAISAIACSGGGDTDGTGSTSVNACFKKCSAPALPANADAISPVNGKEYYSGAGYPACTYNVVCKPGFTAADNHTTSPSCVRNTITVYYDPNGGTEAMNPQNCPFGDDCYAVDNAFRRAGYVFVKWCTTASGGGICINQNGNIGSFVNGIVTLYAQWAPCNNGMYSDNNNSSGLVCRYCPKGTYAPAGATAYASCLNAGVGYRTSNCANSDWTGCRERVQCEIGTYSDIENAAAICTLCPAGKYCPTAGAGSVGALPNCGAGYYCPIGSINGKGWDGYDNDDKLCAAGYYCPAGSDTATEIICPVGSFCPEGSGQPTPCPSNNYCVQTKLAEAVCNPGYALNVSIGGVRTCDIIAGPCPIDNGVGERNVVTGICEVVSCNAGYSKSSDGLACKSKTSCQRGQGWNGTSCVPCSLPGALDYSLAANGECVIAACAAGHHLDKDKNECAPNTRECSIEKGEGVQSWTNKSWGGCVVSDCDSDYHIENNMCVENTLPCAIDNGRGVKKWIGSAANGHWSDCEAELCNAGYTSDRALTNDWTVPCGRCNNYYGYDGSPAVGSYSSECNIAVCLYQGEKYVLEGDECVPICENREDDTGIMKFNSGTNKCERNCEDGYVSW